MKRYIYILILSIAFLFNNCEEKKEYYTFDLDGYVKEGINKQPLYQVEISLKEPGGWGTPDTKEKVLTDSNGYFSIKYKSKEYSSYIFEVNPDKHHYFFINNNKYDKYETKHKFLYPYDDIENEILLDPLCLLKISYNTNNKLTSGDTLIITYDYGTRGAEHYSSYTISKKYYAGNLPPQCDTLDYVFADRKLYYKWKIKREGMNWSYFTDTIICEPFTVNEYTIAY